MKIHVLETFEGIQKPSQGLKARADLVQAVKATDAIRMTPWMGGVLIDWGELTGNQERVCTIVGASNVKSMLVTLDEADRAKVK